MATRTVTFTAATLAQVAEASVTKGGGVYSVSMNVVAPGSYEPDWRSIELGSTSLTAAQRTAFIDAWGVILADLIAQDPAYT